MAFKPFFDVPVAALIKPQKKHKPTDDERGCKFCSLNKVEGIQKIKGTIRGKRVLVLAQSPGPDENEKGKELVGPAGEWWWAELARVGVERDDVDIQNGVRCFPADLVEGTYQTYLKMRSPTKEEIHCCSLYTDRAMEQSKASQILVLGQVAAKALLKTRSLPKNKIFWSDEYKARIYLLDHPAFFIRGYGAGPRHDAFRKVLDQFAADRKSLSKGRQNLEGGVEDLSDQYAYVRKQDYRLVTTTKQAKEADRIIRKYAAKGKRISVDIEDDRWEDEKKRSIIAIGFSPKPGLSFTFMFRHDDLEPHDLLQVRVIATRLLQDEAVKKVMHYGCSDWNKLAELEDIIVAGYTHDTNLSEYLRFSDQKSYGLDAITERRFPQFSGYKLLPVPEMMQAAEQVWFKEHPEKKKSPAVFRSTLQAQLTYLERNKGYHLRFVSLETLRLYNGGDCDVTKRLEVDNRKHVPQALMSLYIDLSFVLYDMEPNGPLFDYEQYEKLAFVYPSKKDKEVYRRSRLWRLERKLRKIAGDKKFKPGSPQQVAKVMYEKLELIYPFDDKPNTKKMAMLMLGREHEFPRLMLTWRSDSKVGSTLESYERSAKANNDRLRTRWWACLPVGELVLTNRGYLPIEDVEAGHLVVTHKGRAKRVLETVDNGVQPIVRVTLSNGLVLRTTYNHRYRVSDTWVKAENLKLGMPVVVYGDVEQWKPVREIPIYKISSWGRVAHAETGRIRSVYPKDKWGHLLLSMWDGDHHVTRGVASLVAKAFIPDVEGKPLVRHFDGYAWDNTVGNLRRGTTKQNRRDAQRHGSTRMNSKVTEEVIARIRSTKKRVGSDQKLAAELGISRETVKDIRTGRYHNIPAVGKRAVFTEAAVVKIEALPPEATYGLVVNGDASHVTGGIVTHNTGARTGRLSSGGEKQKKESTLINLQNIKKDSQMQNMCVADREWKRVYRFIAKLLKPEAEVKAYWAACDKSIKEKQPKPKPSPGVETKIAYLAKKIEKWIRKNMPDLKTYLILDYGQVEVRVAAQMSGDKNLIKDCQESDIHTRVGVTMTGWDADRIKNDIVTRTLTKNVHFGILFGISKKNLYKFVLAMSPADMRDRLSQDEVDAAYDRYFARYTGIRHFIDMQREFAREHGYVETLFGMKQTLTITDDGEQDEYIDPEEVEEGHAYWGNQAINGPVQGTAHQLMICALVNLRRKRKQYAMLGIPPMEVHDALYFAVRVLDLSEAIGKACNLLEKESLATVASDFPHIDWKVPIAVDTQAGLRLGDKVEVDVSTSVGVFMIDWYRKARANQIALNRELEKVAA